MASAVQLQKSKDRLLFELFALRSVALLNVVHPVLFSSGIFNSTWQFCPDMKFLSSAFPHHAFPAAQPGCAIFKGFRSWI